MTNPSEFIKTSDADTKKYLTDDPYTAAFTSAAVSVGVGTYATRTYVIPLSALTRFFGLWVNISLDGGEYIKIPNRNRLYASNAQNIATTVEIDNGQITLTLYLVNQSGVSQSFPAFDVNIIRRDYVDEQ
jgi:hypothetical protein